MKIGWGTGQVLALLVLALVLVTISVVLEIDSVAGLVLEGATTESDLVSQNLYLQIRHIFQEAGRPSLELVRDDLRLNLILQAAIENSPSVVFVAVCDSLDRAIAHTTPTLVGSEIDSLPGLPEAGDRRAILRLLASPDDAPSFYVTNTALRLGESRFATIRIGIADVFLRERLAHVFRRGLTAAVIQVALAVGLGFLLVRILTKRIRLLEAGVTALREGHFDRPIPETGLDEFGRLARDLNLLSERFQQELKERDTDLGAVRQTVELLGEGILTIAPDQRIALINGPAGRILGVDPETARNERLADLLAPAHPLCQLVGRLTHEPEKSLTIPLPTQEGETSYVAIAHRIEETGEAGGILIEMKEEAALAHLHSLVDHSKVLSRLGQMAAGVAHEIRNPLQTINLELSALQSSEDLDSEEVNQHVRAAMDEMQRLHRAISGFLKIARLRELRLSRIAINELLEETHRSMEGEANLSGLDLELDLCPELPDVPCDREVLRQAIENLVKNAIQALPSREGKVVLESRVMNGDVGISVADTGPGIPHDHLERATDLYFTTKQSGSGVGLALVRQAVELHGGKIELDSTVGEGTVVTLKIPAGSEA